MLKIEVNKLKANCDIKGTSKDFIEESAIAVIAIISTLSRNLEIPSDRAENLLIDTVHAIQNISDTVMFDMNAMKGKDK